MKPRTVRLTTLALILTAVGVVSAQSGSDRSVETVATFDSPGATENICQAADGSIYVTGMDDRIVWKISPNATAPEKFATLTSHAVVLGVAPTEDGVVVTATERPFRRPGQAGNDFSDVGPQVIVLDKTGKVTATIPGQKGQFFNGITPAGNGRYLIADTNAATVWQINLAKKQLEVWFKSDTIAGANGIKVHNGWVYFSDGSRGPKGIQRIQMENGQPKGMPISVGKDARADDFDVAKDGTIYFPSGTTITKVSPSGEVSRLRENIQGGPAALVSRDGKWLYWPTRGGEGPQKLLRTAIP